MSNDATKAIALFKWPCDESATTPGECNDLHEKLQASLLKLDPSELQRLLKALSDHHHSSYPIESEQTYHALADVFGTFSEARQSATAEQVRVSIFAAAAGDLGKLVKKRVPTADVIESDVVPGQSAAVMGVSKRGYPLLSNGEEAAAATYDAVLARNCFYSAPLAFTMLRAMLDLLAPDGLFCIAFVRQQARVCGVHMQRRCSVSRAVLPPLPPWATVAMPRVPAPCHTHHYTRL